MEDPPGRLFSQREESPYRGLDTHGLARMDWDYDPQSSAWQGLWLVQLIEQFSGEMSIF